MKKIRKLSLKGFIFVCAAALAVFALILAAELLLRYTADEAIVTTERRATKAEIMTPGKYAGRAGAPLPEPGSIDINTADVSELQRLPGIGPALAQAIADRREEHGAFRNPEDITQVPGIGDVIYGQIEEYITVGERTE